MSPRRTLVLDAPRVMTILNVTPDSFSDGGTLLRTSAAVNAAQEAIADGADILDIGGESTRPGASRVNADEQIARVTPAIRAIRAAGIDAPITIDTTLATVADAALDAGADAINDVSAGTEDPEMLPLAASRGCGVVLMHRAAPPDRDSYSDAYATEPAFADVTAEVRAALEHRAAAAADAGVHPSAIVLDPGLGFGKSVAQNFELVRQSSLIVDLGFPVLGGASRKSFVGRAEMAASDTKPREPAERVAGSIAFSLAQLTGGVRLFRVHDTGPQARALRAWWKVMGPPAARE